MVSSRSHLARVVLVKTLYIADKSIFGATPKSADINQPSVFNVLSYGFE